MTLRHVSDRESFLAVPDSLEEGDVVEIDSFAAAASDSAELLNGICRIAERGAAFVSLLEQIDTRTDGDGSFFTLCRALHVLDDGKSRIRRRDGIERAKEEGRYKGRKPIAVDEGLFDSVIALWQSGQITAREAMAKLNLKPNTFYRRIKEREEQKMKDYKMVEQEIRDEIKQAARQGRRDLGELRKQVREEVKEVKKAADEKLELHDVEREMRHDRLRAEAQHLETVRQLKKDVKAEAEELKKLVENEG